MKKNHSAGKLIGASVLALAAGLMQPFAIGFAIVCVLATVLTSVFFAWAGFIPAIVYTGASLVSLGGLYGPYLAGAYILLAALPSGYIVSTLLTRQPFARRMTGAVLAQLLSMLALIVILYFIIRQDLIQALLELVTGWIENLPPVLATFLLQNFAATGALSEKNTELALGGLLNNEQTLEQLNLVFKNLSEAMRLQLPGLLLGSGLLTGVLATAFSGRICAGRGDDIEYVSVDRWFMPKRIVVGLAVCLATGLVLVWLRVDGAEAVFNAFTISATTMCMIGGVASISRRLKAVGRGRGARIALVVLGLMFASTFVMLIGALSALLGRKGVISTWIRKKMEENNDRED